MITTLERGEQNTAAAPASEVSALICSHLYSKHHEAGHGRCPDPCTVSWDPSPLCFLNLSLCSGSDTYSALQQHLSPQIGDARLSLSLPTFLGPTIFISQRFHMSVACPNWHLALWSIHRPPAPTPTCCPIPDITLRPGAWSSSQVILGKLLNLTEFTCLPYYNGKKI